MSVFSLAKHFKPVLGQSLRLFSTSSSCFDKKNVHMKESVMYNYSIYMNFGHLMPGVDGQKIAQINVKIIDDDKDSDSKTDYIQIQKQNKDTFKNIKDAPVRYYTYN